MQTLQEIKEEVTLNKVEYNDDDEINVQEWVKGNTTS